jgi:phosphoglycerate kinase
MDIEIGGKKVLVRCDFNVPIIDGEVSDDTRIVAALPTINYLVNQKAAVILMSHLGRPGGEKKNELSLEPVAKYLAGLLKAKVDFIDDCIGPKVLDAARSLQPGDVLVLENTRFHKGEKENDPAFSKELAGIAEIFVNDAFGTAHRSHASNVGVASYMPAVAGFLIEKEVEFLGGVINEPKKPFTAILGGAKVSGKIGVINNLIEKVDVILIGGGMANTFFASQGFDLGKSLVERESIDLAAKLLEKAQGKIKLPVDLVIADNFSEDASLNIQRVSDIPEDWMIMDIGPETLQYFGKLISTSATIVWNGPMGVFEFPAFSKGTTGLAQLIAESNALSIVGGGDSAAAINQAGMADEIDHISTGGGASLKMLEGASLPGLEALHDK